MQNNELWTVTEAAAAWGITPNAVRKLIARGRLTGTEMQIIGGKATWTFPAQAKPEQLKSGPKPKS